MIKTRRNILKAVVTAVAALSFGAAQAAWPERPVTLILAWAAGGGTDAIARFVAAMLEKELGQPVNVVNRTGGNGVVGNQAIASAAPDGYTIGMGTVEITMMRHQGLTQLSYKDYTPIALMNVDSTALMVGTDSSYKSFDDLLKVAKASPGKLKASGTGQGGIWHLGLAGMLGDLNLESTAVRWVPSNGAAPALVDLAAGGVDLVSASLPEARSLIDAGKVRPVLIMANAPSALYPNVPTLKSLTGSNWAIGAWRGILAPKGLPVDIQARLSGHMQKIYDSKEYKDFMSNRGFGMMYADPVEFGKFMEKGDNDMGQILKALGMAR